MTGVQTCALPIYAIDIEDLRELAEVVGLVGGDLLRRQHRARLRLARRVAHARREVADDQHRQVPRVLERAQLRQHHGPAQRHRARGGIDAELDAAMLVGAAVALASGGRGVERTVEKSAARDRAIYLSARSGEGEIRRPCVRCAAFDGNIEQGLLKSSPRYCGYGDDAGMGTGAIKARLRTFESVILILALCEFL